MSMSKYPFMTSIIMILCFNVCCDAFTQQRQIAAIKVLSRMGIRYRTVSENNCDNFSNGSQSVKPNNLLFLSYHSLATTNSDMGGAPCRHSRRLRFPIVERSHEKCILLTFGSISAIMLHFSHIHSRTNGLPPIEPGKWLIMAETALSLSWSSMIVAISFLEAWTKFRAPFLKKYVAVDVGRYVFAALNSAELGLVASFWLHRLFLCWQVQTIVGGGLLHKSRSYYEQFTFTLPAAATMSLLFQVLFIAPQLYVRAKRRILDGFDDALPSVKISLSDAEQTALMDIAQDFRQSKKIPSRLWHSLYALLEIVKIGCLNAFVVLSWLKALK